jgi:hypothetical protein
MTISGLRRLTLVAVLSNEDKLHFVAIYALEKIQAIHYTWRSATPRFSEDLANLVEPPCKALLGFRILKNLPVINKKNMEYTRFNHTAQSRPASAQISYPFHDHF